MKDLPNYHLRAYKKNLSTLTNLVLAIRWTTVFRRSVTAVNSPLKQLTVENERSVSFVRCDKMFTKLLFRTEIVFVVHRKLNSSE